MGADAVTRTFDFSERLAFSLESRGEFDVQVILRCLQGTRAVQKTDVETDKTGTDYIAVLDSGIKVNWDVKRREKGCSIHWQEGPELALETWSVKHMKKVGWTLDRHKTTDYVLFVFDESDHDRAYAVPFQQLRTAFNLNGPRWCREYRVAEQKTNGGNGQGWISECVFVPVHEVLDAINAEMVRDV